MDDYSAGPFSRVFFFHTRDGLLTYTYRRHRAEPARTLIHRISCGPTGGPTFHDVFVNTALLRP